MCSQAKVVWVAGEVSVTPVSERVLCELYGKPLWEDSVDRLLLQWDQAYKVMGTLCVALWCETQEWSPENETIYWGLNQSLWRGRAVPTVPT